MIQIYKRSIGKCILLSFVTCGIYLIYWEYLLVKNVKALKNDTSGCAGEMACLMFVPFYSYYWWFTRGKTVKEEFSARGISATGSEVAYLLLWIFGLGLVAVAIMQNDFNSLPSNIANAVKASSEAYAVVGLVCGILGLVGGWIPYIYYITPFIPIVGIIVSSIALKKGTNGGIKGIAIAGLVLGIIDTVINVAVILCIVALQNSMNNVAYIY